MTKNLLLPGLFVESLNMRFVKPHLLYHGSSRPSPRHSVLQISLSVPINLANSSLLRVPKCSQVSDLAGDHQRGWCPVRQGSWENSAGTEPILNSLVYRLPRNYLLSNST